MTATVDDDDANDNVHNDVNEDGNGNDEKGAQH